jgi:hypothetical protein
MLFMVIEKMKDLRAVGERFKTQGRLMPEGVIYHASWLEPSGLRCFQVMEAPSAELLDGWVRRWSDLMDLEVVPVLTSAEYWAREASGAS